MVEAAPQLAAAAPDWRSRTRPGSAIWPWSARRTGGPGSRPASSRSSSRWTGEMRRADLVVCRAGATTLSELAAAGRPAILVPLPTATDDHQRKNAEALAARRRGAMVIEQRRLTGERLAGAVLALARDAERAAGDERRGADAGAAGCGAGDRRSGRGARARTESGARRYARVRRGGFTSSGSAGSA